MKNLLITCFFHVDEFLRLILLFLRNHPSGDDQYGRSVRGFWRQILVYTLLLNDSTKQYLTSMMNHFFV